MQAPTPPRLLPPIPPLVRLLVCGVMLAAIAYLVGTWSTPAAPTPDAPQVEATVVAPDLDRGLLAQVADTSRDQRLQLETEPLRHLLRLAIDVGPTVAAALGMPAEPVPLATVRADLAKWRGRWIWYEGELVDLSGPRPGHPIDGYSIYEATIRLADGEHAIAAFSMPPEPTIQKGSWVRIEGYLLKLRDTTYPLDLRAVPMLVGRAIQRDYEDWGPVRQLDPAVMAKVEDTSFWPQDPMWRTIEEDQGEPLWHLAAFARDTAGDRTFAEWRRIGILNAADLFETFKAGELLRGTPLRIIGTLIRRTTVAAPANPAGIKFWTVALVQVREWGGALVPIWVPKRVGDLPMQAQLEVRGLYYRRFAYEAKTGKRHFVPLFVAADLDRYELATDPAMRQVGLALAGVLTGLMLLFWWGTRRSSRETQEHQREMDARRRRRRERRAATRSSTSTSN